MEFNVSIQIESKASRNVVRAQLKELLDVWLEVMPPNVKKVLDIDAIEVVSVAARNRPRKVKR